MRNIDVCAGIGDNIWLIQKLINSGEKFSFHLPAGKPQRGKQIFDILPQIGVAAYDSQYRKYTELSQTNIANRVKNFYDIKENWFSLSINQHLEQGRRIEDFLPDLPTSFRIDWQTENEKTDLPDKPLIGIYASAYNTARAWGFWKEDRWCRLILDLHNLNKDFTFVMIGADWDLGVGSLIIRYLYERDIPYINTIGRPLSYVVEVLKKLKYLFAFPSGIGILAPTVGCPVTMFYPNGRGGAPDLRRMINAWASPEDIETKLYNGVQFCEPTVVYSWFVNEYKILDRL